MHAFKIKLMKCKKKNTDIIECYVLIPLLQKQLSTGMYLQNLMQKLQSFKALNKLYRHLLSNKRLEYLANKQRNKSY